MHIGECRANTTIGKRVKSPTTIVGVSVVNRVMVCPVQAVFPAGVIVRNAINHKYGKEDAVACNCVFG